MRFSPPSIFTPPTPPQVQDFRFLCPNGTAFDQEAQTCADWGDVDCEQATLYYGSDNFDLYRIGSGFESKRAPADTGSGGVGGGGGGSRAGAAAGASNGNGNRNGATGADDEEPTFHLQRAESSECCRCCCRMLGARGRS